jgi:hypothetical protein
MGDAKSHTQRLKLKDPNININILYFYSTEFQRVYSLEMAIAPIARVRHYHSPCVNMRVSIETNWWASCGHDAL